MYTFLFRCKDIDMDESRSKVSRKNWPPMLNRFDRTFETRRIEWKVEEDCTVAYTRYISNSSTRENQLICVTVLRKLPWKRTGCTMGCCIGRQALSRVSLFHPTDMSNAGCISIYAPSQNSPRRGSLFLSSFLSSLFVLPAPGWRPARHFLSISRMFLRFPV